MHEAGALLLFGLSLFVFLSLFSAHATGEVGRMLASPLRLFLGVSSYVLPTLGIALSVNGLRGRPGLAGTQWGA
ncbi:MAG: hypothetical protein ACREQ9_03520, partial [Candidatus Binatia bacterium]